MVFAPFFTVPSMRLPFTRPEYSVVPTENVIASPRSLPREIGAEPSVPEILISTGLVAAEVMAYIAVVKTFPILAGRTAVTERQAA